MKSTALNFLKTLCCIGAILAILAGVAPMTAMAASHGIYLATATPHYRHPQTGIIEDSGGESSAVLGQSMTDSATYTKALVEVDSSGNTYATVRLKLMDNIQDPKFQVDAAGNGSFTPVSSTVMYEDFTENTTDFRMKIPNENAVIRCNMYVVPMGREVIFYITLSGLQQGSGDFVTTIKVDQAQSSVTNGAGSQTPTQTESQNTAQTSDGSDSSGQGQEPTAQTGETHEEHMGIQEFDQTGEEADDSSGISAVWWIAGVVVIIVAAGGSIWFFRIRNKKDKDDLL